MSPTQRYRELIADLESHCAGLGESQVVGVSRASCANQTRLRSYEFEVGLVAEPPRFADRQDALVDLAGSGIDLDECSLMPRQSRIGLVLAKRTLSRAPAELGLFWQTAPALHRYPISGFSPPSSIAHARLQSPHDARRRLVRQ